MNNTKEERFHRVASARTAKNIAMLRLLGNCSDPRSYTFFPEEAQALLQQVEVALEAVKERYANPTPHKGRTFVLQERNDKK